MNATLINVNTYLQGILLQQQYLSNDVQLLKVSESVHRGRQPQYGRLTISYFPKFVGDDVKGWMYRCNNSSILMG